MENVSIEHAPPNNSSEPTGPLIEKTSKSNLNEQTPEKMNIFSKKSREKDLQVIFSIR